MVDLAQTRTKDFLDTNLDTAILTKDDGTTPAPPHVQWQDPPYLINELFSSSGKNFDVLYSLGQPASKAITDSDGSIIGYNEQVPIRIQTVDKTGVTATLMLQKAQEALREAVEHHWAGSYRSLNVASKAATIPVGGMIIWGIDYVLTYEREAGV